MILTNPAVNVDRLRQLLGNDVLLLHWPLGVKGTERKWGHLTVEVMRDAKYLNQLAIGNIGVALGKKSSGLCVIDWDAAGEDEKFIALNPFLADTLRTHGNRGSSFWLRLVGEYPASKKLKVGETKLGEWRANGNQSIIAGIHPDSQKPYRFLREAEPVKIEFSRIVWPDGISFPTKTELQQQTEKTNTTSIPLALDYALSSATQSLCKLPQVSESSVVEQCVAIDIHTSNSKLFALARGVLTLERQARKPLVESDLARIFSEWYARSVKFLRPNQSRDKYFEEFLNACDCAERPLDENPLALAWAQVQNAAFPEAAEQFKSSAGKKLVSLCWQLQLLAGEREFFLACRSAAPLLEITHVHVAAMMRKLVRRRILKIVEQYRMGRATRYRFGSMSGEKGIAI